MGGIGAFNTFKKVIESALWDWFASKNHSKWSILKK